VVRGGWGGAGQVMRGGVGVWGCWGEIVGDIERGAGAHVAQEKEVKVSQMRYKIK
jgi:hypothetical protein